MTREEIYDKEIAPLIVQLSDLCRKHGIAHLMTCQIADPGEPARLATTLDTSIDDTQDRCFRRQVNLCALLLGVPT